MMKNKIKELLDQATILAGAKTNEEIAEYLESSGVIAPNIKLGDTVYFLAVRSGAFGSLLTSGFVEERKADAIIYDGKIKIASYDDSFDYKVGSLYEYLGEKVFLTKEGAEKSLEEMRIKAGAR